MADPDLIASVVTQLCEDGCHVVVSTGVEGSDAPTVQVHLEPRKARMLAGRLLALADVVEANAVKAAGRMN